MDDTSLPMHDPPHTDRPRAQRPHYRVPVGLPLRDEGRRAGAVISVLIHAAIIGLLIVPFFLPTAVIARMQQGAGGEGPAGGGGGGSRGSGGGTTETLRFVKVSTQQVPTPTSLPPVPQPVVPPVPKVEPPKPVPAPVTKTPDKAAPVAAPAPVPGAGGGSGADGSAGAGPGSGGGVGSGVGPGKGSSNGPGTGGGTQTNYPPQPIAMFLPPLPTPQSLRGFTLVAEFDIDSTGRVLDYKFTPSPDGGYNRQLAGILRSLRFRPGTRPDGSPVRMKSQIIYGPF